MQMAVMPAPGTDEAHPGLAGMGGTEAALDAVVDEDTVNAGQFRGHADQPCVGLSEKVWVHGGLIGKDERALRKGLPRPCRDERLRGEVQPNIGIQPNLMAGMSEGQGTASGLAEIANPEIGQAGTSRTACELTNRGDQHRVAPVAVPREPHGLPARPFGWEHLRTGNTAE